MQRYQRDNYKKKLAEALLKEENKKLTVHFHVDKNRWALLDENKDVYGTFNTPEEIVESVESGIIENSEAFENILKHRKTKGPELTSESKLFVMDQLYGKKGHTLRESLAADGQLPGSEMSFDEVMGMLDDGTEHPDAIDPATKFARQGGTHADNNDVRNAKPLYEMCEEEVYEMCESCYEEAMHAMKELYSACDYKDTRRMVYHEMYENMWESRKKTLEMVMNKLRESMQDEHGMGDEYPSNEV